MKITDWAIEDRPREKLLHKGASSLSDAELLAILIGSGNLQETAVQLSQRILHSVDNNLNALGKLSVNDLISSFKGIGEAKAVTIAAALELGKRRRGCEPVQRLVVQESRAAYSLFYPLLCDLPYEELWIALLNRANRVIEKVKISQGGVGETHADIRLILKAAIQSLAASIILCHNHPSGVTQPSAQDDALTQRLKQAVQLVDIRLLDHIIISDDRFYSYTDEGRL
ncbi:RadC family protein [Parabacteroides chinchillae]|uniref:DNA repair protein RadC n=1 Tax=Parabacteroides chinchillae TaxID=871327 RepID=A0A8G2F260_9BACT|nr:DNA repair protein RadC [Parabacteroides chinchillae]SEG13103.1 DNA repair protein RadC [Parabacteroides chinchillae]